MEVNIETYDIDESCYVLSPNWVPPKEWEKSVAPQIMDKLYKFLQAEGHQCMRITEGPNYEFTWCQKDNCAVVAGRKKYEGLDPYELKERLEKDGHTCIEIGERCPIYVDWCQHEHCTNK